MSIYTAKLERNTLETQISMSIGFGENEGYGLRGTSGIGFFDHMLNSFAIHSKSIIGLSANGDLNVDCHHTIEDIGIVLGKLLAEIAAKSAPIKRYGTAYIPMDETLARSVIDISGRAYLVFDHTPCADMIGNYDTQMTKEFFRAVSYNMGATLHISVLYKGNEHHAVEAIFKAFAHSVADALENTSGQVLSAKGVI